jgi:hypothetical protein
MMFNLTQSQTSKTVLPYELTLANLPDKWVLRAHNITVA